MSRPIIVKSEPGRIAVPQNAPPIPAPKKKTAARGSGSAPAKRSRSDAAAASAAVRANVTDGLPEELIETLSTFDKGEKSKATSDTRTDTLVTRLKRSHTKVDGKDADQLDVEHEEIDNRLLIDPVGRAVAVYEKHAQHTGQIADTGGLAEMEIDSEGASGEDASGDDDDVNSEEVADAVWASRQFADEEVGAGDSNVFMGDEDDDDENEIAVLRADELGTERQLLVPVGVEPDIVAAQKIRTFQEQAALDPKTAQFSRNMQFMRGREQAIFVEVDPDDKRYNHVTEVLSRDLGMKQLAAFSLEANRVIPDLPFISRAEIQAARFAADPAKGEKPCVNGVNCTSYLESMRRKRKDPSHYAGLDPFPCKEFYYGQQHGAAIREAVAAGMKPDAVQDAKRELCVMCNESLVTKLARKSELYVLEEDGLSVLHGYRVNVGALGEYHPDAMIVTDGFCGVIGNFIRYDRSNYIWEPNRKQGEVQGWTEGPALDFR